MRCFTIVFLLAASGAAHASNFTVTNANDAGPGSLRQAITDANADANEPHTITIQASGISSFDIVLQSALPIVTRSLTLTSQQPATLVRVPAAGFLRFSRLGGGAFRMSNLRVFRDPDLVSTIARGGCLSSTDASGVNGWTMLIEDSEFTNCSAYSASGDALGGAIYANGDTELVDTVIQFGGARSVTGEARGAAIYVARGALSLTRVTIAVTTSGGQTLATGAIGLAPGTSLIALDTQFTRNFTFADNRATGGGAIYADNATVELSRVSFTGHDAQSGTAIYAEGGELLIENASFFRNVAPSSEVGLPGAVAASGIVAMRHTAFWGNTGHFFRFGGTIFAFSGNVFVAPNLCFGLTGQIPAGARANFGTGSCADGSSFSGADPRAEAFGRVAPTDAVPVITFGDGSPVRDAYGVLAPSSSDFNLPGELDARLQNRPRDDNGNGLAEADAGPTESARLIPIFSNGFE
jgi:predicted outer membrane repeat protein